MNALTQPREARQDGARLSGGRIRQRRLMIGLKQASLAEAVGISPSYLNLIEHNRRKIGGKLLIEIARALGVEASQLAEGADATIHDALRLAAMDRGATRTAPETDRIDDLAARFPGWTELISAQSKRLADLEATVEGLRDRMGHDPVLSETMHEVLSSAAAIRSTADILARERDLEAAWLARFHRNLDEEARRLSERATAMLGHFEVPDDQAGSRSALAATPVETVEALFDAHDHHFAEIEISGASAIARILGRAPGMEDAATRAMAEKWLTRYADDAARLPLAELHPAAKAVAYDPAALLSLGRGDVALVLRRLSTLPPDDCAPAPGLAICDASGALLFRRRLAAFSIPRFGPGCPRWPLYAALARPGQPDMQVLEMPTGQRFQTWAVAQSIAQTDFGQAPVVQATMLIAPATQALAIAPVSIEAGPGCALCPRKTCPARR